jgi:hypothetical protein
MKIFWQKPIFDGMKYKVNGFACQLINKYVFTLFILTPNSWTCYLAVHHLKINAGKIAPFFA